MKEKVTKRQTGKKMIMFSYFLLVMGALTELIKSIITLYTSSITQNIVVQHVIDDGLIPLDWTKVKPELHDLLGVVGESAINTLKISTNSVNVALADLKINAVILISLTLLGLIYWGISKYLTSKRRNNITM